MLPNYWHKQTTTKALFPDLLWSRPENKLQAGKLVIIGGSAQEFASVATAYQYAQTAGIGTVRVLLPDSLQKSIGRVFTAGEYAPATPIGSFGQQSLASWFDLSLWADGVLLAGDLGRNSETGILIEQYLSRYEGQVTITCDAVGFVTEIPMLVLNRERTCLVLSMSQLQKFAINAHFIMAFTIGMDLTLLIDRLNEFTKRFTVMIITKHLDNFIIAVDGQVSTTKLPKEQKVWRLRTASYVATWWLQNPSKAFEAFNSAILELIT
jgi:NAD(P)H-hydrate repair Nnr-like enzyme with NAD(P)H-hydrate dehydratase domain